MKGKDASHGGTKPSSSGATCSPFQQRVLAFIILMNIAGIILIHKFPKSDHVQHLIRVASNKTSKLVQAGQGVMFGKSSHNGAAYSSGSGDCLDALREKQDEVDRLQRNLSQVSYALEEKRQNMLGLLKVLNATQHRNNANSNGNAGNGASPNAKNMDSAPAAAADADGFNPSSDSSSELNLEGANFLDPSFFSLDSVPKIPTKVWTYWDAGAPPSLVLDMISGWKRLNPDHEITLITRFTITTFVKNPLPPNFDEMQPAHMADWVRLAILMEQGGIWMDPSIICTSSFDHIHSMQQTGKSEGFSYHLESFTSDSDNPVIESWLIATVPRGRFITAWFNEFNRVFANFRMGDAYLDHLKFMFGEDGYKRIKQENSMPHQLKILIAAQKVITMDLAPHPYSEPAEKGPYKLLKAVNWNDGVQAKKILTEPCGKEILPGLIKIRAEGRSALVALLEDKGLEVHADSIYANFVRNATRSLKGKTGIVGLTAEVVGSASGNSTASDSAKDGSKDKSDASKDGGKDKVGKEKDKDTGKDAAKEASKGKDLDLKGKNGTAPAAAAVAAAAAGNKGGKNKRMRWGVPAPAPMR
ncbi:hypothetical protein HDU97_002362 [Phlyctochytrium planicorne]|nr:hypothetical protein HDU97_002362 [Phlyctochytrium planicorne]